MGDEREEINLILNHPAYENSLARACLWVQIYGENLIYEFSKIFERGRDAVIRHYERCK